MGDGPALEVRGVSKAYGRLQALRGVDLAVPRGAALAIFGPNGAGKSTLLKIMATASRPTRGTVRIEGQEVRQDLAAARRRLGLVSHQSFLYRRLDARENLSFYGSLYGLRRPAERAAELIERVGLAAAAARPVGTYSRGMLQRLTIARALVHDPPILLLDEPYTGLDPQASLLLGGLLAGLSAEGRTLVLTTHDIERGLAICGQAALLAAGRLDPPRPAGDPASKAALAAELLARLERRAG